MGEGRPRGLVSGEMDFCRGTKDRKNGTKGFRIAEKYVIIAILIISLYFRPITFVLKSSSWGLTVETPFVSSLGLKGGGVLS